MFTTAWLTIRRWVADASVIEDRRLVRVWDSACQKAKLRRVPMLRDSQLCLTPLVVGVRNLQVLIPNTILDCLDEAELESVFIHELMHLRRRDAIVRLSAALVETVYFMFPWIWLATWRLSRLREDACDEATVIALKGKRKPYGSAILKTAEMVGYQPPSLALGMRDSHRTPRGRLERLLDAQLPLAPTPPVRTVATLVLIALVFLPGGARPANSDTHSSRPKTNHADIDSTPISQASDGTTTSPNSKAPTSQPEHELAADPGASFNDSASRQLDDGQLTGQRLTEDAIEVANDSGSRNSGSRNSASKNGAGELDTQITNAVNLSDSNTRKTVSDSPGPEQRIVSASYSRDEFASAVLDPLSQQRILEQWDDLENGESLLISLLRHRDWELRAAALRMLKTVGTTTTLPAVERVYLEGSPSEQRLAKETPDQIWARTRADVPDSTSQQNMELIFD